MSSFRTGEFDRQSVPRPLRRFCPARAVHAITDIDPADLVAQGKKLVLLDVDNTLVHWHSHEFEDEVLAWIEKARGLGLEMAILSNTRRPQRLAKLSERLNIPTMKGKFKPNPSMYRQALDHFKVTADEAIMIGDQLFTDILGANRSGIEAVWVKQMSERDFIGTKVSRMGERLLRSRLYPALIEAENALDATPSEGLPKPEPSPLMKQIIRFGVVGITSFIIDAGLSFLLIRKISTGGELLSHRLGEWLMQSSSLFHFANSPDKAAAPLLTGIAALVAMYNSFVWNRRWTFEIRSKEDRMRQLGRFYFISIIGYFLNVGITTALFNVIPGHPNRSLLVAKMTAALVVAIWNFTGQRMYAFRPRSRS